MEMNVRHIEVKRLIFDSAKHTCLIAHTVQFNKKHYNKICSNGLLPLTSFLS